MARRSSFSSTLNAWAREAARSERQAIAEQNRRMREQARAARDAERAKGQAAKEEKQRYLESRIAECEDAVHEVADRITSLQGILSHTLSVDDTITFKSLRPVDRFPKFSPPASIAVPLPPPDEASFLAQVRPPGFFTRSIGYLRKKYEAAILKARCAYQVALARYRFEEENRQAKYNCALRYYQLGKSKHDEEIKRKNDDIDQFERSYFEGDPQAIVTYNNMVLERSEYPDDFPQNFRIAYVPESKELVIEYELPTSSVIPTVADFKYIKSKDVIEEKPRKPSEIKDLYQDIVTSITLRSLHEVMEADQGGHLAAVVFNGFVQTTDAATGKDIRPCLISVRVTKERFEEIQLDRVDKRACLRNLGAQVSPRPDEVQPVKPIVDFNMVDKRFVDQSDVLSDLESRPNLMDLNPFEFENLVGNLFAQLGLETKLTRSSRDGGVDVVAFDLRPVLGGKVVIQAKRWKNTVGVSAVRDLYGTMMNEGANKGILVTTSGYGPDAFEFAKDKPIELMDGGRLLYLLEQVGITARIVFPEDWEGN